MTNSIGRLYDFLRRAKDAQGGSTRVQLGALLGVSPDDPLAFLSRLTQVLKLIDEAEAEAKKFVEKEGRDTNRFIPPYERIRQAFLMMTRNTEAGWEERKGSIQETDLTILHLTADLVPQSEELIEKDELDKLIAGVEDLTTTILESGLDEDFKLLILRHLQDVRNAVYEYQIRGAVRLREAGLATVGVAVVVINHIAVSERGGKEVAPKDKEAVSKFWRFATWLVQLATLALKAKPLLAAAVKALPHLIGSSDIHLPELGPGDIDPPAE